MDIYHLQSSAAEVVTQFELRPASEVRILQLCSYAPYLLAAAELRTPTQCFQVDQVWSVLGGDRKLGTVFMM